MRIEGDIHPRHLRAAKLLVFSALALMAIGAATVLWIAGWILLKVMTGICA